MEVSKFYSCILQSLPKVEIFFFSVPHLCSIRRQINSNSKELRSTQKFRNSRPTLLSLSRNSKTLGNRVGSFLTTRIFLSVLTLTLFTCSVYTSRGVWQERGKDLVGLGCPFLRLHKSESRPPVTTRWLRPPSRPESFVSVLMFFVVSPYYVSLISLGVYLIRNEFPRPVSRFRS